MLLYVMNEMYLSREHPSRLTTCKPQEQWCSNWLKIKFGANFTISYLEHTFRLLQQNERLFVVFALNEIVRSVSQLGKDDGDFILVHFDLFIVHLIEGVALLRVELVSSIVARASFAW
jgi:hypothetical protein